MPSYWLVSVDIIDPSFVDLYLTESDKAFRKFGARLLARAGKSETVEGKSRSHLVVVEFKDYTTALECYHSPEYTIARNVAKDKAVFDVVITEGYTGPQPTEMRDRPERYNSMTAAAFGRPLPSDVRKEIDVDAPRGEESKHIVADIMKNKKNSLPRGIVRTATKDLGQALKAWRIWVMLATNDVRQRYRRSTLGQFWITASIAVMVAGLGIVYSAIFHQPIEKYLPYVAAGFVVWFLITGMITDGCSTFLEAEGYAKQLTVPLSVYVLRTWFRNFFTFAHNAIIFPFVWLIFSVPVGWSGLLAIPGIFLIALNGLWIMLLLGTLCARFRDLPQIVSSSMQVVFFLTPVMFQADQLPSSGRAAMVLNPFAALLAVARDPLVGLVPSALEYAFVIGILLFGWAIALLVYGRYRRRITYWL